MTSPKKQPGAPRGNKNAQKVGADGQINVRVPRELRERLRGVARITGDMGLSALSRRLLEAEAERVESARVGVIIDQQEAERVLREVGVPVPSIPTGANTAEVWFATAEGHPALAINQTGFKRRATDPDPVNGLTVLVLVEGGERLTEQEARNAITEALRRIPR